MKKVSNSEIERLYRFTREHFVVYYDVQTELVDHLANGIECQWQDDPGISFEQALQKEFKKFGVYGFSDVVEKRERAMGKKYHKLILKEIITILKRPKVSVSMLLIFWLSNFFLNLENGQNAYLTFLFIVLFILLIFVGRRSVRRRKAKEGKKVFLFETMIENAGGYFSLVWVPFQLLNFMDAAEAGYINWLMSFLIAFYALTSYVCFFRLPKNKEEILKKVYPKMKYS
ncbi:hypothetical protein [Salinimicrobium sp. TH3]|uniref:hypothetical protein n=1 Tax=Salinimicrobium sp. TH3 TaxID=2997342 RepID=UPI0022744344|nr:hypothetical protein [Salinimicrobium sp. TH3]MCY2686559.1 hypothetical protein [Salinimicrobium sp. TH3]